MASTAAQGAGAVLLLIGSNAFMNTAWYLHLKFKAWPILLAIVASWGIAFFEYCLQVPANRMGHYNYGGPFSAPQLKVIQEAISLSTFAIFSVFVLKEKLRWTDGIAFALIFSGVAVGLAKPAAKPSTAEAPPPEVGLAAVPPAPTPTAGSPTGRRLLAAEQGAHRGGSSGQEVALLTAAARGQGSALSTSFELQREQQQQQQHGGGQASLQDESSTAVVLASGVEVYASSSQQGLHSRRASLDREAGAAPAGGAPEEQQPPVRKQLADV